MDDNGKDDSRRTMLYHLNELDEALSRPIFQLSLPKWAEFAFSVPANFFGKNACLFICPLWIALLAIWQHHESSDHAADFRALVLGVVTVFITALHVVAWGYYQFGNCHSLGGTLFWNHLLYLLSYPWILGVLALTVLGMPREYRPKTIFSVAIYPLVLWPFTIAPLTKLKRTTRRNRPATKDAEQKGTWTSKKKFPASTKMLVKYSTQESFPSGDVMMATLMATPLWEGGFKRLAFVIVLLSGLGRMYVLAHHLSDVVAGASIAIGIHQLAIAIGYEMHQVDWWHPLLAIGAYVGLEIWSRKSQNSMDNQGVSK
mmetsp:Transcript_14538/g.31606  ORF Transcript_14538/g.31606 Transcript_14538/m.31606 type:complete len:315 (+) Transcript_14538:283-1227(+)